VTFKQQHTRAIDPLLPTCFRNPGKPAPRYTCLPYAASQSKLTPVQTSPPLSEFPYIADILSGSYTAPLTAKCFLLKPSSQGTRRSHYYRTVVSHPCSDDPQVSCHHGSPLLRSPRGDPEPDVELTLQKAASAAHLTP